MKKEDGNNSPGDSGLKGDTRIKLQKIIDTASGYPLYKNDSTVVLYYKGEAKNVSLLSDITGWTAPIPFIKAGDDLFYLGLELESDARIQYLLIVDGNAVTDPLNKYKSLHGMGEMSELAMPEYKRHEYLNKFLYGKQGSYDGLYRYILPPGVLPYEHEVMVYLPPGYKEDGSYPSVYFHDGPDYIRYGLAPYSISRLIADDKIEPCIAVFVTPPNLHVPAVPNRSTEYGLNDNYVRFFCDEVVPFIDRTYRTAPSPQKRTVAGDSYAGLISFYIAFMRPEVFANAFSQSGYFSFNNNRLIKLFKESPRKPVNLRFDAGTYEKIVGADFIPPSEYDFTKANRRMKEVLSLKGYDFIYREYHDGHTWGNWRRHLIDALICFLGKEETK